MGHSFSEIELMNIVVGAIILHNLVIVISDLLYAVDTFMRLQIYYASFSRIR